MKINLTYKKYIIEEKEVAAWFIDKGDGAILINLNKVIDEDISECTWLGNKKDFVRVDYYDWDSNEFIAIIDNNGQIIRKGIVNIDTYIEEKGLFVVNCSGYGLKAEEAMFYSLSPDDLKMAVIDTFGSFIISPVYDKIEFDEYENIFCSKNIGAVVAKYTIEGKLIE